MNAMSRVDMHNYVVMALEEKVEEQKQKLKNIKDKDIFLERMRKEKNAGRGYKS
jgi:hypothetical protein